VTRAWWWPALCVAVAACSSQSAQQPRSNTTVILQTANRAIRVEAEVVRTPEAREKGLMHRRELAAYRGMLFIFDREERQSFWMKNTYIPLDMIFISEGMRVVGMVEDARPVTTESRGVEAPSRYVLEVNGGFVRRHGIARGDRVRFEAESP
jgi:uncharacterized membrane protein (UPF0127 family)